MSLQHNKHFNLLRTFQLTGKLYFSKGNVWYSKYKKQNKILFSFFIFLFFLALKEQIITFWHYKHLILFTNFTFIVNFYFTKRSEMQYNRIQ